MADSTMTLLEYLSKTRIDMEGDFLREGGRLVARRRADKTILAIGQTAYLKA